MQTFITFLTPNILAETFCLLAAFVFLNKDTVLLWRLHQLFLVVVISIETVGIYLHRICGLSNHGLYNGYLAIEGLFVSYFLFYLIKEFTAIKTWWLSMWLLLFYAHYGFEIWKTGFQAYLYNTVNLLGFGMVIGALFFFIVRLQHIHQGEITRSAGFWWVYGVFFFYTTGTTIALLYPWFAKPGFHLWGMPLSKATQYLINIITYSIWAYSYYIRYRQRIMA